MSKEAEFFGREARNRRAQAIRLLDAMFKIPAGCSNGVTAQIVDSITECAVARVLEIMQRQQEET